ncbi:hypothetical protein F9V60_22530 [Salmonella enterica subsp. enterica serovar Virchow]|uniref:hypothetical protein n=1 Tax=Enterobacterales TaxID=91347 RepID=UPI00095A9CFA|nr:MULTISPECIES: hypothetical protein [Enterobacterales]ECS2986257.1 hypothetical protein [Salmonella enterica subsp. enterica serovar Reading]EDB3234691.1 hypothetical protein [Salmonella enterica subsp. enterica serovar Virchow]EKC8290672.1 hypothetical protein [Escherichia coli]ECU6114013.1 hypothetical protein [Salmonella enterica subsp. enterica serovar Reading]MCL8564339.1 hypothetical protein [Proteus mirabilis]
MISSILILLGLMALGVAWWAFGQWLRKRGYGSKLDQFGASVEKGQGRIADAVKSALPKGRNPKK